MREVKGLRSVKEWEGRPHFIPEGKVRGVKREGIRFEEKLGEVLPRGARRGVWLEFVDEEGKGFAQVDWVIPCGGDRIVVGEAKLTWKLGAYVQLRKLYIPLISALYGPRLLGGVVLCRNLTWETPRREVAGGLDEAVRWIGRSPGMIPTVHYALDITAPRSRRSTKSPCRVAA